MMNLPKSKTKKRITVAPTLLSIGKKRLPCNIYAHRASRGLAPENTLFACDLTLNLGVDFIDFDVVITKDDVVIALHDTVLNPDITRDRSGNFIKEGIPVESLTFKEIQSYNVGTINPSCNYAGFFPNQHSLADARIPSLQQIIDRVHYEDVGLQIEIKTDENSDPEKLAYLLYPLLKTIEHVEVQSFDFRCLKALNKIDPTIKTSFLTLSKSASEVLDLIQSQGGSYWGPFEMDVTEADVQLAHALGLKVVPWGYPELEGTEFNRRQILKLIEWGVDGIITDRPDLLIPL